MVCFVVLGHNTDVKDSICTTYGHLNFASYDFRWYASQTSFQYFKLLLGLFFDHLGSVSSLSLFYYLNKLCKCAQLHFNLASTF